MGNREVGIRDGLSQLGVRGVCVGGGAGRTGVHRVGFGFASFIHLKERYVASANNNNYNNNNTDNNNNVNNKKKENKAMVSLSYSCYFCLLTYAVMMYSLCLLTPSMIAGVYNG